MTDYINLVHVYIIVCSKNVTIQHTKYIAEDSFSADMGGFEGHFLPCTVLWKVNII